MAHGEAVPPLLTVKIAARDAVAIRVEVVGEVDLCTSGRLQTTLTDLIDEHRPERVMVDFAGVPFLDASGISALLAARSHALGRGAGLWLLESQPLVSRVLRVMDLYDLLTTAP